MTDPSTVILRQAADARPIEIDACLLEQRIVFLGEAVRSESANRVVKQLLYLNHQDSDAPITLYLNTPGGSVVDGMAIYDTMRRIPAPIHCVVSGMAASMGSILLSGCEKGHRQIMKHGEVLLHQPLGGASGQVTDIEIRARQLLKTKEILIRVLSENTGQPYEKVLEDCDRDHWLNAEEALDYGIVDEII